VRRAKGIIERQLFQPEHIAELRLYGMVRYLLNLRQQLRDTDEKERIVFERKFILKRLAADALELVAQVSSLLWITFQIIDRLQPVGQFLYVQQIVSRALTAMNSFVTELSSLDEQLANLFDYQEFMSLDVRKGGEKALDGPPEHIRIDNVSFAYPSSPHEVLRNVSLSIDRGQRVAIVGENGAGKSTLIKLLSGLYAPSMGSVTLDGTPLGEFSLDSWHKQLAVLQQDYLSYKFATAKDNVVFGQVNRPFDQDAFDAAVQKAEAGEFMGKLPKGADSYVSPWMAHRDGTNGVDLSGGQWQRLALARNFYRQAPIIILDEPTSAIDALAESRIFNHLFADTSQTLIIISHRLTTIERADVIFMLKDGQVVEQGTARELVGKRGEFFTMFESQI
jgi:ATP-binding cassette subfamily B protein